MEIINALLGTPISILVFLVGFALIFAEMLQPGFGIAGGLGLVCLIIGIILTANTITQALIMGLIILIVVALMIFLFFKLGNRGKFTDTLFLKTSTSAESGFSGTDNYESFKGLEGITQTVLRPTGIAVFGDTKLDVITSGEYISAGSKIKVIETEGNRIVVAAVEVAASK